MCAAAACSTSGVGRGRFCRVLSGLGASVTGVDLTEPLIEQARGQATDGGTYLVGDAEGPRRHRRRLFRPGCVLYCPGGRARLSAGDSDRPFVCCGPAGRFIVCNVHPMRMAKPNGWVKLGDRKLYYALDDYCEEGPREFEWWGANFINMHRTLSSYILAFLDSGFVLESLLEPTPSDDQLAAIPWLADEFRVPNFIIYALRKPLA